MINILLMLGLVIAIAILAGVAVAMWFVAFQMWEDYKRSKR